MPGPRGGDAPVRRRVRLGPMTALTWDAVLAWRAAPPAASPSARRPPRCSTSSPASAALHAQVAASAELTLWARVDGLEAGTVERLLWEERALVKTWAMRGTLHLLPAAELRLYVGGARARSKPRHHQARLAAPPRPGARAGRGDARRDPGRAGRRAADPRGARRRRRRARPAQAALAEKLQRRLRRPLEARRLHRAALLRALATAGACASRAPTAGSAASRRADPEAAAAEVARRVPRRLRPGAARAVPALVRHDLAGRGRALARALGERGRGRGGGDARVDAAPATSTRRPRAAPAGVVRLLPGLRPVRRRRAARRGRGAARRACATGSTARRAGSRPCVLRDGRIVGVGATSAAAAPARRGGRAFGRRAKGAAGGRRGRGRAARGASSAAPLRLPGPDARRRTGSGALNLRAGTVDVRGDDPRDTDGPSTAIRRSRIPRPGDETGFGLIEGIVAAVDPRRARRSACWPASTAPPARPGARRSARSPASLAEQDQERMRTMRAVDLPEHARQLDHERRRRRLHGRVRRSTGSATPAPRRSPARSTAARPTCCGCGRPSRRRAPGSDTAAVRIASLLAPPIGSAGGANGTLAVAVKNRDGAAVIGLPVTITATDGSYTATKVTNALGCALFTYIPADTYDVAVNVQPVRGSGRHPGRRRRGRHRRRRRALDQGAAVRPQGDAHRVVRHDLLGPGHVHMEDPRVARAARSRSPTAAWPRPQRPSPSTPRVPAALQIARDEPLPLQATATACSPAPARSRSRARSTQRGRRRTPGEARRGPDRDHDDPPAGAARAGRERTNGRRDVQERPKWVGGANVQAKLVEPPGHLDLLRRARHGPGHHDGHDQRPPVVPSGSRPTRARSRPRTTERAARLRDPKAPSGSGAESWTGGYFDPGLPCGTLAGLRRLGRQAQLRDASSTSGRRARRPTS